jgi:hypothetical protein
MPGGFASVKKNSPAVFHPGRADRGSVTGLSVAVNLGDFTSYFPNQDHVSWCLLVSGKVAEGSRMVPTWGTSCKRMETPANKGIHEGIPRPWEGFEVVPATGLEPKEFCASMREGVKTLV